MTVSPRTRLTCDHRGRWCIGSCDFDGRPRDARSRAKATGWRVVCHPSRDICPACVLEIDR